MSSRNVVELLARAAPKTIGWLQVPLTPSRQAAIAAFELRTGRPITEVIIDILDDEVFALQGAASCVSDTRNYPQSTEESSARSCKALHDCAVLPSDEPARLSGPSKPPRSSPPAPSAACEPPATSFQASANHQGDQSLQSSPKYQSGRYE